MDELFEKIDVLHDEMVAFLGKLVNIDSGIDQPDGIKKVSEIIGDKLLEIGFTVEYLNYPGKTTHVMARKKGTGSKNVMIIGHTDTVFPKGTAAERPFTIKDGKAYGPGVLDMKSGITIALFALQALREQRWNEKNITIFFSGDEEMGHPFSDAKDLYMKEAKDKDAVFNMETGSDSGTVVVGRRGLVWPEITVTGKAAHSGKDPEKGASATLELAYKIIDLYKHNNAETGIAYNAGIISGGITANGIAGEAKAVGDFRFRKWEQYEQIKTILDEVVRKVYVPNTETTYTIDEKRSWVPMEMTDANLSLYEIVRKQGEKLGIQVEKIYVGASSDSCWTSFAGAPTICAMGARGELNHSEREYMHLYSLTERAKLLALSIQAV
jgi:glutamate carboxypeptidase